MKKNVDGLVVRQGEGTEAADCLTDIDGDVRVGLSPSSVGVC